MYFSLRDKPKRHAYIAMKIIMKIKIIERTATREREIERKKASLKFNAHFGTWSKRGARERRRMRPGWPFGRN